MSHRYFAVYKPYGMLSQFSKDGDRPTLAELGEFEKNVYPVGRLDADSEGLLLLTNDRQVNDRLLNPKFAHSRTYLVQVDGDISEDALDQLRAGPIIKVKKKVHHCTPCLASKINEPQFLPKRIPPVRYRASIPTSWIELTIKEGKNRQVRRMTAAVGFPTLRLVRYQIEDLTLDFLNEKSISEIDRDQFYALCNIENK